MCEKIYRIFFKIRTEFHISAIWSCVSTDFMNQYLAWHINSKLCTENMFKIDPFPYPQPGECRNHRNKLSDMAIILFHGVYTYMITFNL